VKILLSALHFGYLRNFDSVVALLAERGHVVRLLADEPDAFGGQALAEALVARYPARVSWGFAPSYEGERWFLVARKLRLGFDYLRFLEDPYFAFPKLHERLAERVPRGLLWLLSIPGVNSRPGRRLLRRGLAALDAAMPRNPAMDACLADVRPDVLLLTSITNPRAPQLDHLRSARALRIQTGISVYSWDHLSSKALIRVLPDRVLVWNDTQKREAVELHGVPAARVTVTGAQCYDQLFRWQPGQLREDFCRAAGLPPNRPYVMYVCSALTPDPREAAFVVEWVRSLRRSSDGRLRTVGVLIRPHPERRGEWDDVDLDGLGPVVVHGRTPFTPDARSDYYHGLAHSAAVVGLVTSAFLEAAIIGRPVLTLLRPELTKHQEGMLHFRYLLEVEGGLLQVARHLHEHCVQLSAALDGTGEWVAQQRRFLRAFIRPHGLEVPATDLFADAVEALGASESSEFEVADATSRLRPVVDWIVERSQDGRVVRPLLSDTWEAEKHRQRSLRLAQHARDKHRRKRQRRQDRAERERALVGVRRQAMARKAAVKRRKVAVKRVKRRENRARLWSKRVERMTFLGSLIRKRIGI